MLRATFACCLGLMLVPCASAQAPGWQFRWTQGQAAQYRVEHTTMAAETTGGKTSETRTKLNLVKRWTVLDVDSQGVATLQLQLDALRLETTPPSGKSLLFDSAAPEASNPQLKEQLGKYLGTQLAVIRIDRTGKVVEVRESKYGPATAFETTPPFMVVLPAALPQVNQYWERQFTIKLDPPQGTGEKHEAVQRYLCKQIADGLAVLTVSTTLKAQPASVAEQLPLLQLQPEGEVTFNITDGRLQSGTLKIDKEVKGHAGENSGYRFQSLYREELVVR